MTDIFNKKNLERSYKFDIFRAFREAEISRNELNKIGFKISKHSWTACLNDSNIGNLYLNDSFILFCSFIINYKTNEETKSYRLN